MTYPNSTLMMKMKFGNCHFALLRVIGLQLSTQLQLIEEAPEKEQSNAKEAATEEEQSNAEEAATEEEQSNAEERIVALVYGQSRNAVLPAMVKKATRDVVTMTSCFVLFCLFSYEYV